jgi:PAS domain S-box-containing protein
MPIIDETKPIRVLVADDAPALRAAIAELIDGESDLELAGSAANAVDAIALAELTCPDVALIDMKMPGGGALAARGITACSPETRVLALSAHDEGTIVVEMLRAGAIGYLVKSGPVEEIVDAIRRASRGQASMSAELTAGVIEELTSDESARAAAGRALRDSEATLRALLDFAPAAAVNLDASGEIVLVNRQAEALFGYPREQLLGRNVAMLLPERFRDGRLAEGPFLPDHPELAGLRKDGSEFAMDVSLSSTATVHGQVTTAFVRDVGEQRAEQREGRRSRERLVQLEQDIVARRELLAHLVDAGEAERRRMANDIHDDSIQAITAAGMRLQILRRSLADSDQLALLDDLEQTIQLSIARLRRLLFELLPPVLDHDGLSAALRMYLDETADGGDADYRLDDTLATQPPLEARLILYRIAQEALTNTRKHARARDVTVRIDERDDGYGVRVTDDGVGFDSRDMRSACGHLGLAGMRERAELAGGWLRIESATGAGTTVECWVPAGRPAGGLVVDAA